MTSTDTRTESSIPPALIDCARASMVNTLAAICGEAPAYKGEDEDGLVQEGIVGIISLVGDVAWTLMVGLPKDTAEALALSFAGFEITFDSEEIGDFAGELANTIGGDLQNRLHDIGVRAELSLPTVARGSRLELLLPGGQPCLCMHFVSAEGEIWFKIATARKDR